MYQDMKTPYFVINEPILEKYYSMLTDSLSNNWGNYLVGYSFKTNSLPWLVRFFQNKGAYAEVVSDDEYKLAKYMNYADNCIVYNGPYKEFDSFKNVILSGGYVNLDSFREIEWLKSICLDNSDSNFKIGIRCNFNLESMCPGETTMGDKSGRFGFCYETGVFNNAISMINEIPNAKISGIHLHSSSKSRSVEIFKAIATMACKIKNEFNLSLEYIDIGGGYCGGMEGRPEYPDYFDAICPILKTAFSPKDTKIIVEPGVSMISKCTTFVTSVFDVRDIKGIRYIMTDGSRFNIDPTMIKSSYLFHVIYDNEKTERKTLPEQQITGFSCMEADRLFEYKQAPELMAGDKIVYENVGGYTMSLNPLFIQYFPAVYLEKDGVLEIIRKKWTPTEYVQNSIY